MAITSPNVALQDHRLPVTAAMPILLRLEGSISTTKASFGRPSASARYCVVRHTHGMTKSLVQMPIPLALAKATQARTASQRQS